MVSETLKRLRKDYAMAQTHRSPWKSHWDSIQRYVRPDSPSFSYSSGIPDRGNRRNLDIYDGTAPWALGEFAAGMHSMLTDSAERWFDIVVLGRDPSRMSRQSLLWLEEVSDRIYFEFSLPKANVNPVLHENYLDIGSFGTAVQFQYWDPKMRMVRFRACPLARCTLEEGADGVIDRVWYSDVYTPRKLVKLWPHIQEWEQFRKLSNNQHHEIEVVHLVQPRDEWTYDTINPKKRRFASFYFCPDFGEEVLEEGGFDYFPYNAPRWTKLTGETYGRSPAMSVLPDIQMVNQMAKEIIISAQLANFPPVVFDSGSILISGEGADRLSLVPRSVLWKQPGSEMPQPLNSGMQPNLTLELIQNRHERITQAFYIDHLIRQKKRERQTTTEILDDRNEMMRQLSPHLGRLHTELLGNMISNSYFLLNRARQLPQPPPEIEGEELKIHYRNPVSKAQYGNKAAQISLLLQDLSSVGQVFPNIFRRLDEKSLLDEMAMARDVTRKIFKDERTVRKEDEAAAQQQQMAMAAEMAPGMAKSLKDVADARQTDPNIAGLLG